MSGSITSSLQFKNKIKLTYDNICQRAHISMITGMGILTSLFNVMYQISTKKSVDDVIDICKNIAKTPALCQRFSILRETIVIAVLLLCRSTAMTQAKALINGVISI